MPPKNVLRESSHFSPTTLMQPRYARQPKTERTARTTHLQPSIRLGKYRDATMKLRLLTKTYRDDAGDDDDDGGSACLMNIVKFLQPWSTVAMVSMPYEYSQTPTAMGHNSNGHYGGWRLRRHRRRPFRPRPIVVLGSRSCRRSSNC